MIIAIILLILALDMVFIACCLNANKQEFWDYVEEKDEKTKKNK